MKSVFESYPDYFSGFDRPELKAMLSGVGCLQFPADSLMMNVVKNKSQAVVVTTNASLKQIAEIVQQGFEHVIAGDRPDFPQELLAASLMAARLQAFAKNPIPFFFTGFQDPLKAKSVESNMVLHFKGSSEKSDLLKSLTEFLHRQPKLKAVSDLCVQAADEMLSNAMFSAPTDKAGKYEFQDRDRASSVAYPADKQATLFVSFSDYRVVVGVEDPYGSLRKDNFTSHLVSILEPGPIEVRRTAISAGVGIRFMIDNAANFYVYTDKKKRTVFACGFLLKGVKANLNVNKHLHCSFR